jgi:hypothetical protein
MVTPEEIQAYKDRFLEKYGRYPYTEKSEEMPFKNGAQIYEFITTTSEKYNVPFENIEFTSYYGHITAYIYIYKSDPDIAKIVEKNKQAQEKRDIARQKKKKEKEAVEQKRLKEIERGKEERERAEYERLRNKFEGIEEKEATEAPVAKSSSLYDLEPI